MLNRLLRYGMAAFLISAVGGYGVANADSHENPCDDDENPCGEGEGGGASVGGEAGVEIGGDDGGGGGAMPGLTLGAGKLAIDAWVEINLSSDAVFKPFSIAPDVWYGVSDKLTVGLVHSGTNRTGFVGGVGNGLCLAGEDNGCAKVYDAVGVNGIFSLSDDGKMALAANGGIYVNSFDPFLLALKLGVDIRYLMGKIAIVASPNLFIGLTERDFNKEFLNLPVMAIYQVSGKLGVGFQTGLAAPLDGFGDFFVIPLSFGGHYMLNDAMGIGAAFSFPLALGSDISTFDARSLNVWFNWHN